MKVETYACDQCKTQKKDANHWFKAYRFEDVQGVAIVPWKAESVYIAGGGTVSAVTENADAHLCGANCVTEWLSKNLF